MRQLQKRTTPSTHLDLASEKEIKRTKLTKDDSEHKTIECPRISSKDHPRTSPISLGSRQDGVKKLHAALLKFYAPMLEHEQPHIRHMGATFAARDALNMEADVMQHANVHSYKSSSMTAAAGILKRSKQALIDSVEEASHVDQKGKAENIMKDCTETGTALQVQEKRKRVERRRLGELTRSRLVKAGFLCPKGDLTTLGYLTEIPEEWGPGGDVPDGTGEYQTCIRCSGQFKVAPLGPVGTDDPNKQDPEACRYHAGRPRREALDGNMAARKVLRWTCCGRTVDSLTLGDDRCSTGPHVYKEEAPRSLHRRAGYRTLKQLNPDSVAATLQVAALDCEMSYTTAGLSVTRITLVDESGDVVFDELIRCANGVSVVDFNTQFSGIQPGEYEAEAVLDLDSARRALAQYIGPDTILIGHGLENDLHAIRLVHTNIIDTCQLFPHPRGLPYRLALRDLVSKYLGKIIQAGGSTIGHSSAEDAQMTLELVRWKWLDVCSLLDRKG
ncbi:Similar to S.cerevisiae protein REX3 (RNA exonuclease) [Malassezia sympodialis ATCC 42132]|uniref:Similar to S.cerevisiae protein REX3 (RNA exonuclease) n=2 Tax=Malassezia sympodialis (strain ATCC 42132) TaxID=1230383 RepID=A0A1M8A3Z3_MALS4|nr:Similar to S.cerevisiae protein REX3 (RNA exonuclease) [Malassezia sympodialis ATCC 42132]